MVVLVKEGHKEERDNSRLEDQDLVVFMSCAMVLALLVFAVGFEFLSL